MSHEVLPMTRTIPAATVCLIRNCQLTHWQGNFLTNCTNIVRSLRRTRRQPSNEALSNHPINAISDAGYVKTVSGPRLGRPAPESQISGLKSATSAKAPKPTVLDKMQPPPQDLDKLQN